jgi:hypothetical protein
MIRQNPALFGISTLKYLDLEFSKLPPLATPRNKGLAPWVKFYPRSWQYHCTYFTRHDWERSESVIRSAIITRRETEQSTTPNNPVSVDIRAWVGAAILWRFDGRLSELMWAARDMNLFEWIPIPQLATAVANFKFQLTCDSRDMNLQHWYASAVSLLTGVNYSQIEPVDNGHCVPCRTAQKIHEITENKQSSANQAKLNLVLRDLVSQTNGLYLPTLFTKYQATFAADMGLQFELPTSNSMSEYLQTSSAGSGDHNKCAFILLTP